VRYLLDECLNEVAAGALQAFGTRDGHTFRYIASDEVGHAGALDGDIPSVCQSEQWDVLITANVRDFGARKVLYQALIASGVHVVVLRPPGKRPMDEYLQASLLSRHYKAFTRTLQDRNAPGLLVITDSGIRERTLDELVQEIQAYERRLP
jgi:hypothetical protein